MEKFIFVRYAGYEQNLSVKLTKEFIMDLMDSEDFIWYCKTNKLKANNLRSYFCISPKGKMISPRWIIEYLKEQRSELFIDHEVKTFTYNHSTAAVSIFEKLGIKVEKFSSKQDKTIDAITQKIIKFRNERNLSQFHNPKDLAISLSLEASELLGNFQWNPNEDALERNFDNIKDELADVFIYGMLIAEKLEIDLTEAIVKKIEKSIR